jgi:hypothetical protein
VTKAEFFIDLSKDSQSSLEAHHYLARSTAKGCFHNQQNVRMPFGIYNVSVHRVCDKLVRLCRRLESYFSVGRVAETPGNGSDDLMVEVIDYIELTLYAAAEHVDDIDWIATGYFAHREQRDKSAAYKTLQKEMKQNKRFVSSAANAIKHQQSRIRIYSMDYQQGPILGTLHGYFMEGVEAGVVGPSSVFHRTQEVFSVTTLVWEVIYFVLASSLALCRFLKTIAVDLIEGPVQIQANDFSQAVAIAARLPAYTFGEEHPFARAIFRIRSSSANHEPLESKLLGSAKNQWSQTVLHIGQQATRFAGDGVSRSFRFVEPKVITLIGWG